MGKPEPMQTEIPVNVKFVISHETFAKILALFELDHFLVGQPTKLVDVMMNNESAVEEFGMTAFKRVLEHIKTGQAYKFVEAVFEISRTRKEAVESSLEQLEYEEIFEHIKENNEFWTEASDKTFLFRMLDGGAEYDEVKEWLEKESIYRINRRAKK